MVFVPFSAVSPTVCGMGNARMAQLVAQPPCKRKALGSSPSLGTIFVVGLS